MGTLQPTAARGRLAVTDLSVRLGDQQVLSEVGLEIMGGEVVGLVGPNGAGKTTLVRAITRVVDVEQGSITIDGRSVFGLSRLAIARCVAVVQQIPVAPATLRVGELALLGRHPHLRLLGRESASDLRITWQAMERAGCAEFAERPLHTLSGGERRRAFIARALAQQPRFLLLDEPTANLDVDAQGEIFELLRELAREDVAVLVVVHELSLAASYCDRLVLLADGRIRTQGAPAAVLTDDIVRETYGERVTVIRHPETGSPLIVPRRGKD